MSLFARSGLHSFLHFFFIRLCAVLPSIYSLLWLAFYQIKVLHFVMLEMAIGVVCGVEQIGGNRTAVFILLWILFKLNLSANILEKRTDGEDFRIRIFVGSFLFWSVCLTDDHALFPNAFLHVLIVWFWFLFLYRQRQREINFIHSVCVFFYCFLFDRQLHWPRRVNQPVRCVNAVRRVIGRCWRCRIHGQENRIIWSFADAQIITIWVSIN